MTVEDSKGESDKSHKIVELLFAKYQATIDGMIRSGNVSNTKAIDDIICEYAAKIPSDYPLDGLKNIFETVETGEMMVRVRQDSKLSPGLPYNTFDLMSGIPKSLLYKISRSPHQALRNRLLELTEKQLAMKDQQVNRLAIVERARLLGYRDLLDYVVAHINGELEDAVPAKYGLIVKDCLDMVFWDYPQNEVDYDVPLQQERRDFGMRYAQGILGLSASLASSMPLGDLWSNEESLDAQYISELRSLYNLRIELSAEQINRIHEHTGIVNFTHYSRQQLHRMLEFADGNELLLSRIRKQPVIVCVRDVVSDHDGAFGRMPQDFEGDSATTLFFEMSGKPNDAVQGIKDRIDALGYSGISYDTLILGGHDPRHGAGNILNPSVLRKLFSGLVTDESGEATIVLLACNQDAQDSTLQVAKLEALSGLALLVGAGTAKLVTYSYAVSVGTVRLAQGIITVPDDSLAEVELSPSGKLRRKIGKNHQFRLRGLMSQSKRQESGSEGSKRRYVKVNSAL